MKNKKEQKRTWDCIREVILRKVHESQLIELQEPSKTAFHKQMMNEQLVITKQLPVEIQKYFSEVLEFASEYVEFITEDGEEWDEMDGDSDDRPDTIAGGRVFRVRIDKMQEDVEKESLEEDEDDIDEEYDLEFYDVVASKHDHALGILDPNDSGIVDIRQYIDDSTFFAVEQQGQWYTSYEWERGLPTRIAMSKIPSIDFDRKLEVLHKLRATGKGA